MFSLDALDWAGIWPKAVAGGCKPVYQMKWEINTVLDVLICLEFWAFCHVSGKIFQKVKRGHSDELRSRNRSDYLDRFSSQLPAPIQLTMTKSRFL